MYYDEESENENKREYYGQNTFSGSSDEHGGMKGLGISNDSDESSESAKEGFENNGYQYSNGSQGGGQFCGVSPDYRESSSSINSNKNKKITILKVIGLILLVAVISMLSCFAFLKITGLGESAFKVEQQSSDSVNTSVDIAGTDVLTTPQIVKSVIPTVVEVNVTNYQGSGSGSGIVFSEDGYIVTNQHVVDGAQSISIKMSDGKEYEASLVGQDEQTDLAVVKVNAKGLKAATIGSSGDLAQGETVLVIGNPLGETLSGSVSQGIISALGREIEIEGRTMHYIQTDAAINPGNSGGAMVNLSGQVVGIASAKISSSMTEGLGFAIPIDEAVPVIESLINQGYVSGRPLIGISGEDVTAQISMIYNIPQGVYVRYVDPNSGASKAGIQQGDVIVAADGNEITSMDELNSARDKHKAGETIELTVYRNGQSKTLKIVLGEQTVSEP